MCTREWNMLLPSVVMLFVELCRGVIDRLIERAATSEHFLSANFVTRHHVAAINYVSPKFPLSGVRRHLDHEREVYGECGGPCFDLA